MKKSKVYDICGSNTEGVVVVSSPNYSAIIYGCSCFRTETPCSYAVAEYVANKAKKLNLGIMDILHYMDLIKC